jgi:hypothetical protein
MLLLKRLGDYLRKNFSPESFVLRTTCGKKFFLLASFFNLILRPSAAPHVPSWGLFCARQHFALRKIDPRNRSLYFPDVRGNF